MYTFMWIQFSVMFDFHFLKIICKPKIEYLIRFGFCRCYPMWTPLPSPYPNRLIFGSFFIMLGVYMTHLAVMVIRCFGLNLWHCAYWVQRCLTHYQLLVISICVFNLLSRVMCSEVKRCHSLWCLLYTMLQV